MKLEISPYRLDLGRPGNARSPGSVRRGYFFCAEGWGVAAMQPWPELGDREVEEILGGMDWGHPGVAQILRESDDARRGVLMRGIFPQVDGYVGQVLNCLAESRADVAASLAMGRGDGFPGDGLTGMFRGADDPRVGEFAKWWQEKYPCANISRLLATGFEALVSRPDWREVLGNQIVVWRGEAAGEEMSVIKVKVDGRRPEWIGLARDFMEIAAGAGLRVRMDLNATGSGYGVRQVWRSLQGSMGRCELGSWLEFFEDPMPWDEAGYRQLHEEGVPVASDWEKPGLGKYLPYVRVIKPSSQDWRLLAPGQRVVFSSNLDHPVMLAYARIQQAKYEAARLGGLTAGRE